MRVAVTGSTGLIGAAVCRALADRGDEVAPIVRPASKAAAKGISWDPARGTIDADALEGFDAVLHLAGESIAGGLWTAARKRRIRESRIGGTGLIAATLAELRRPPAVLVSSSAVGFYGDRGDEVLTEASSPGRGFLAETCVAWEAATAKAEAAGLRVVHIRTGLVVSAHGGVLAPMVPAFKLGMGAVLGNGRQFMSWIALEDEVGAILHVLDTASLSGAVNLVGPNPVSNATFTRTLGRVLRRPTFVPAPAFLLRAAMGEMADQLLLGSQRVLPTRLGQSGFHFAHDDLEVTLRTVLGLAQK